MRPKGYLTVSKITLAGGRILSTQQAVDYGWVTPGEKAPAGWDLERHEIPLGSNLFLDQGRQLVAYAMSFRAPIQNYVIQKFGVGTGVTTAKVTDVSLEAPVTLNSGLTTQAIDLIDFIGPFLARVSFTLGLADANGYILSEMGLYSGNDTLMARKIRAVSIDKTSDFSPTLTWRIRF